MSPLLFLPTTRLLHSHSPSSRLTDVLSGFDLEWLEQGQLFECLVLSHVFIECVLAPHASHWYCEPAPVACHTQQPLCWWCRSPANGTIHGIGNPSTVRTWHPELLHRYATVPSRKDASRALVLMPDRRFSDTPRKSGKADAFQSGSASNPRIQPCAMHSLQRHTPYARACCASTLHQFQRWDV